MTVYSNDIGFSAKSLFTLFLISLVTVLASKFKMLWITPLYDKNLFIAFQDVSSYPINLSTPDSTSATASGGILKALISLRLAGLSSPTNSLAASTSGWISFS